MNQGQIDDIANLLKDMMICTYIMKLNLNLNPYLSDLKLYGVKESKAGRESRQCRWRKNKVAARRQNKQNTIGFIFQNKR
jgi:hypothetical protein